MRIGLKLFGAVLALVLLLTGFRAEAADGVDWNSKFITVTGMGVAPAGTYGGQARILAERAARADAYRQFAEIINGVQVDAATSVEQMAVRSDVVSLKVSALIQGARVVSPARMTTDGVCEITMQLPLFGRDSLAAAVMDRPSYIEPFPAPRYEEPRYTPPTTSIRGNYTGVIIDCRGLRVQPVMSPVIKNSNGQKIYGHKNLDPDYVIEYGMVDYASDMSQAGRAGSNPLVIRAEAMDDFNANPVVSVTDANRILSENDISGFLADTAVVFLY